MRPHDLLDICKMSPALLGCCCRLACYQQAKRRQRPLPKTTLLSALSRLYEHPRHRGSLRPLNPFFLLSGNKLRLQTAKTSRKHTIRVNLAQYFSKHGYILIFPEVICLLNRSTAAGEAGELKSLYKILHRVLSCGLPKSRNDPQPTE